jgi:hypothetical protein
MMAARVAASRSVVYVRQMPIRSRSRVLILSACGVALSALVAEACSGDDAGSADNDVQDASFVVDVTTVVVEGDASTTADTGAPLGDASIDASAFDALPAAVRDAGYSINTLSTTSFTAGNLDLGETHADTFTWYPWNIFSATDTSAIVPNADGTLLLKGDTSGPNGEIATIARKSGGGLVGNAFGGGAYFEATFSFDPGTVVDAGFHGWPSWWSLPVDGITGAPGAWWNGDAASNYHNSVEQDFFEFDVDKSPFLSWGTTMHDWYGIQNVTCDKYCDWHTTSAENLRTEPAGTDFTKQHSIGYLWIPATATTKGSRMSFFDRVPIGEVAQWDKWVNAAEPDGQVPATPQPPWALSAVDEDHYFLILGTGVDEPMTVSKVEVWQASTADNQHF